MTPTPDLAIIGAGPAGLSAAVLAVELGLSVTLLDDQPEPGGQIYRRIGSVARQRPDLLSVLGKEYRHGQDLLATFERTTAQAGSRLDYRDRAMVWNRDADGTLSFTCKDKDTGKSTVGQIRSTALLLATGAMERPLPAPGFTLPGVMGAGALQILLKTGGLVPTGRVVLLGGGPLLLLIAAQYLRAGLRIAAIVETTRPDRRGALAALPRALRAGDYLAKGAAMLLALRRHGIPVHRGATDIRALGRDRVEAVSFLQDGQRRTLAVDLLGIHEGVVPHSQLARAIGCGHRWDEEQLCFRPALGPSGESDQPGIWIAGDAGGIAGARAAEHQARLAVFEIAHRLGRLGADEAHRRAAMDRRHLARHLAIRPLLDRLYRPGLATALLPDDTILCRCEEVSAGDLRAAVRDGCRGPNQAKAFLRCGMGPCQGRMCGLPVTQTIAAASGLSPAETGSYRIRPPILPVTLGEIAAFGTAREPSDAAQTTQVINQSHQTEETT